ncbi:MAG: addiction module protein [Gulosibacter sp.]|uniref:addiction module protein n=1 Tax=Gulosibacter sp. TaxID=2817531 RepID=UPI003F93021E
MKVADLIKAAMALTPNERERVADELYAANALGQGEVDTAWIAVAELRAAQLDSGTVRMLSREEANDYLDSQAAARRG